eukprot:UN00130
MSYLHTFRGVDKAIHSHGHGHPTHLQRNATGDATHNPNQPPHHDIIIPPAGYPLNFVAGAPPQNPQPNNFQQPQPGYGYQGQFNNNNNNNILTTSGTNQNINNPSFAPHEPAMSIGAASSHLETMSHISASGSIRQPQPFDLPPPSDLALPNRKKSLLGSTKHISHNNLASLAAAPLVHNSSIGSVTSNHNNNNSHNNISQQHQQQPPNPQFQQQTQFIPQPINISHAPPQPHTTSHFASRSSAGNLAGLARGSGSTNNLVGLASFDNSQFNNRSFNNPSFYAPLEDDKDIIHHAVNDHYVVKEFIEDQKATKHSPSKPKHYNFARR